MVNDLNQCADNQYTHSEPFRTVVLGNFDGLHIGHQQLIQLGKSIADANHEELAVFTFHPQIQELRNPEFRYLLTSEQKIQKFREMQVQHIETIPFDMQIARLSPEAFVRQILVERMHANHIVVGFNYTFGYQGAGNSDLLTELCAQHDIAVTVMQPCYIGEELVSSSNIRHYLQEGNVEKANELLGYVFTLCGEVVYGNQIGRTIGFPTANIPVPAQQMLPANGVYAAMAEVDGVRYPGILNIGCRPTVNNGSHLSIEVHLMDFNQNIYGKQIRIAICHFLRQESRFSGLDALKEQLEKDKQNALQLFAKNTCKTCRYTV